MGERATDFLLAKAKALEPGEEDERTMKPDVHLVIGAPAFVVSGTRPVLMGIRLAALSGGVGWLAGRTRSVV